MTAPVLPTRSFHAGELVSLNWTEEGIVLGVVRPDGARFDLSLNVLRALSIDGFRQSNLISDLCVVSGREPTREDLSGGSLAEVLAVLYPGPARTAKAEVHEDHNSFLEGVVQRLKSGEGALVVLGCGPCGELIAHCAAVELLGPLQRTITESDLIKGNIIRMEKLDPVDLNYLAIYEASARDQVKMVKGGIKASVAKRIIADLNMPAVLTCEALNVPIATINRKAKTGAVLGSEESERILGLAKLIGQVESMVQGVDGAEGFDSRAWTSRWLREPVPALGGAAPLDYMGTMEGQALVSETLARVKSGAYG